ncbi:MAG: hypothetical protein HY223_10505 [Thaumarchaeota archaeon]|nr:hypothetical protein [Nitrososphaerota archaeon]
MKIEIIISCILILGLLSAPAFANLEYPGIKWEWKIKTANYTYIVTTVSNYDMKTVTLNSDNKELIFIGNSTHAGNIAEIVIPRNLIGGSLTVTQDGKQISPIMINGTDSSTIILKFNQTGTTTVNVLGTTYLPEFGGISTLVIVFSIGMVIFTLKTRKF